MAVTTTGSHPKDLWPGILAHWGNSYASHPKLSEEMFEWITSSKAYEEIVERYTTGLAEVKPEGGSVKFTSRSQGVVNRATPSTYAVGEIVTREALDDGQYVSQSILVAESLARSMAETREVSAAQVYNRAFDTNYAYGDGKPILSASHPTPNGSQSNLITAASDLSEAAIEDLCIQIMLSKDSTGKRINLMPKALIVSPYDSFEAHRILKSNLQSGSSNNDTNALRSMGMIQKIIVNPYLSDTDAWFITTNAPQGMIAVNRRPADFIRDNDSVTQNSLFITTARWGFTIGDWRGLFGSPGV